MKRLVKRPIFVGRIDRLDDFLKSCRGFGTI